MLVLAPPVPAPVVLGVRDAIAAAAFDSDSDSDSDSSGGILNDEPVVNPGVPVGPDGPGPAGPGDAWRPPVHIDGQHVTYENYMSEARRGYRRLIIPCRHHVGCGRRRNFGTRTLLDNEADSVIAHLSVWHTAGTNYATKQLHQKFMPTDADVRLCMASLAALPDAG